MSKHETVVVKSTFILLLMAAGAVGSDWPTYRHDIARTGCTGESLSTPLALRWEYTSMHEPRTAWSSVATRPREGVLMRDRVDFDDAFQIVVSGSQLFFGSSIDDRVYALSIETGEEAWSFCTGGPIRLAPMICQDRTAYAQASRRRNSLEFKAKTPQTQLTSTPGDARKAIQQDLEHTTEDLAQHNREKVEPTIRWQVESPCDAELILCENLVLAGGQNEVCAFARGNGESVWKAQVEGRARGLAIADGRLYVSTDKGRIYCFAPGTNDSDDHILAGSLELLWFGEPGSAPMVNRHDAASAPLAVNGRLFIQGENVVMAYDSYNGVMLWKRDIPGAMRIRLKQVECGNLAASEDSFFVALGDGWLFLVDSSITPGQREQLLRQDKSHLANLKDGEARQAQEAMKKLDVKLQGNIVAQAVNPSQATEGEQGASLEFRGVRVGRNLEIELTSSSGAAPALSGLEVLCTNTSIETKAKQIARR